MRDDFGLRLRIPKLLHYRRETRIDVLHFRELQSYSTA
jgi:hypothetical protein